MHSIIEIKKPDINMLRNLIKKNDLPYDSSNLSNIAFNKKNNIVAIDKGLENDIIEIIYLSDYKKNLNLEFPKQLNPDKKNLDFGISQLKFSRCNDLLIITSWLLEMDTHYQIYLYTVPEFELVNYLFDVYDLDNGTYSHDVVLIGDNIIFFDSMKGPGLENLNFKHFKISSELENQIPQDWLK
jgi:hypothetical protein